MCCIITRRYTNGFDLSCNFYSHSSNIKSIDLKNAEFKDDGDSFVSLVELDLDAYRRAVNNKAVRRNVSIPSWLNKAADDAGINVSRVLQEALMEKLQIEQ